MILNKLAWQLLTDDEKMALSLQLGMEKSSWESGEIMARSHYKYLEIKYRATHFLKMFTEHLDVYETLFPKYITGDKLAIRYFDLCIGERNKPMVAIEKIIIEFGKTHRLVINEKIVDTLKKWDKEDNIYNKVCLELVKEFDRWNNFRILPKDIQEPSAFKRRIKNAHKKQLKVALGIHPIALKKLRQLYETKTSPYVYLALIQEKPELFKMKVNKGSMYIFNSLGLYVFKDLKTATTYINEIHVYTSKGLKECTDGLDFWPIYRDLIKESVNYHDVMKITSSRKHLQLAMEKFQLL